MTEKVIMKFFTNGIIIKMPDNDSPFSQVKDEIRYSFEKSSGFFKDASLVLRLEGRKLTETQIKQILKDITEVTNIDIVCVICSELGQSPYFEKYLKNRPHKPTEKQQKESYDFLNNTNDYMVVKKLIKPGDCIETPRDILIFGNVPKDAFIYSKRNVIVLGTIYGTVYAGSEEEPNHFIAALSFQPEKIRIGKVTEKSIIKNIFSIGSSQGKIAYIKKGKLAIEDMDFNSKLPDLLV